MRPVPTLIAALAAAAVCAWEPASAQRAGATVQAAATVVETARVRLDAAAATVTETRGGVRVSAPLRVSGAGSPSVSVAGDGGECSAVPSADASWLRCFVPRQATHPGGITEIRVTLVVVPAT